MNHEGEHPSYQCLSIVPATSSGCDADGAVMGTPSWEDLAQAYRSGWLTVQEMAKKLGMKVEDLLVRMDEDGVHRPVSVLALSDDERKTLLQKLRRARHGTPRPAVSQERVRSEVLSSMRIESVDARRWL